MCFIRINANGSHVCMRLQKKKYRKIYIIAFNTCSTLQNHWHLGKKNKRQYIYSLSNYMGCNIETEKTETEKD